LEEEAAGAVGAVGSRSSAAALLYLHYEKVLYRTLGGVREGVVVAQVVWRAPGAVGPVALVAL